MYFFNKQDSEDVIELISSGSGFCIIIDQKQTLKDKNQNPSGRILRYGKKTLKKKYNRIKNENSKKIKFRISEERKEQILELFNTDKIGLLNYSSDYIERDKLERRKEEIKKQSEADRRRLIKELADDYVPIILKGKTDGN